MKCRICGADKTTKESRCCGLKQAMTNPRIDEMTGYERMKYHENFNREADELFLKNIAENYYNDPMHIARRSFNEAINIAVKEIERWEALQIKVMAEVPFANPTEAGREHKNTMNLLAVIKSKLIKRKVPA